MTYWGGGVGGDVEAQHISIFLQIASEVKLAHCPVPTKCHSAVTLPIPVNKTLKF